MSIYKCESPNTDGIICTGCYYALRARHDLMLKFIKAFSKMEDDGDFTTHDAKEVLREIGYDNS